MDIRPQRSKSHNFISAILTTFLVAVVGLGMITGCEGPAGSAGPDGPQGPVGPAGEDGSMIYAGEGAPSADTGSEGDFYLDKLTGEMYGPKDGNGWGNPISLQGPSGEDGSAIHSGTGSPADSIGVVGDYYLDRSSARLYGPKTGQGWTSWIYLKGPKGDPGEDGNANVRSSGWTQIPAGDWMQSGSYSSPDDISYASISTASGGWFGLYAMEDLNGVVLVYVRGLGAQSGGRDTDVMMLPTHASVSGGGESGGIELRFTHSGDPNYAMWIMPNVGLQSGTWDTNYMINTYLPGLEFKGVIIPATNMSTKGGLPPLDYSDYESVRDFYGLEK